MYDRTNWPRSSFWLTFQSFHVCVFVWRAMEIPNIFFQNFISFMEIPPNEITKVTKTPNISLYIYIYNLYIPPKNFHTKKSPKTCPLFGVSIQKKQQQLTNGFESCLHRPWLPLRPSFFRLWSHWAFWRPEGVGSAGFLVGGWVPSTKHKGRVKATAATSFTPPKLTWNP